MSALDRILEDSEQKVSQQMKLFLQESGKYMALLVFGIMTMISAGNEIAKKEMIPLLLTLPIIVFVLTSYGFIWYIRNSARRRKSGMKAIALSLNRMQNQYTRNDEFLRGKLSALEVTTDAAIYEMDIATGLFVHVNNNWIKMFGWELDEVNGILKQHPKERRPGIISSLMVHEDFVSIIQNRLEKRLNGDTDFSPLHNIWCKNRKGDLFPIDLKVNLISNNGQKIVQGYITNITESRSLNERIDALEDVVESVVGLWGKRQQRYLEIRKFTQLIQNKVKGEINE